MTTGCQGGIISVFCSTNVTSNSGVFDLQMVLTDGVNVVRAHNLRCTVTTLSAVVAGGGNTVVCDVTVYDSGVTNILSFGGKFDLLGATGKEGFYWKIGLPGTFPTGATAITVTADIQYTPIV